MSKVKYLVIFLVFATSIFISFLYPKFWIFDIATTALFDDSKIEKEKVMTKLPTAPFDSKIDSKRSHSFLDSRPSIVSNDVSNLFLKHTWFRPPTIVAQSVILSPQPLPPQPPSAPNMPFVYMGKYADGNDQFIILSRGNRVFTVVQGDIFDNQYRLEKIDANSAQLTYLPLGIQQTISTGSFQ